MCLGMEIGVGEREKNCSECLLLFSSSFMSSAVRGELGAWEIIYTLGGFFVKCVDGL